MELKDILTLIVAVYGAILSSILAIREITKDKRRVRVFLEYSVGLDHTNSKILIINTGHRPITIVNIALTIFNKHFYGRVWSIKTKYLYDGPYNHVFFDGIHEQELPKTIKDGEQLTFYLSDTMYEDIASEDHPIEIIVYDAEGKKYKTRKTRLYNAIEGAG